MTANYKTIPYEPIAAQAPKKTMSRKVVVAICLGVLGTAGAVVKLFGGAATSKLSEDILNLRPKYDPMDGEDGEPGDTFGRPRRRPCAERAAWATSRMEQCKQKKEYKERGRGWCWEWVGCCGWWGCPHGTSYYAGPCPSR